ncbi:hypothetical protein ANCCAN_23135 [Ancylostoma caninum]|uniref:Amidase domain-containing protein n=1 Tax=Ancylostoma caninum TaxID=29170 RepID=A0A368FFT9_ANCCA|nr:hypothetical protein ANCCAN_23135 [Ancylostoma caninum]
MGFCLYFEWTMIQVSVCFEVKEGAIDESGGVLHEMYPLKMDTDISGQFIEYWKSLGIDALICPTFPVPAVPHRFPSRLSTAATYTALFNLLDFPAGAVPAGKVTTQDDEDLMNDEKYPVTTLC